MVLSKIGSTLVDAVYPRICPVCRNIVKQRHSDICISCERLLSYVEAPICPRCGKPVDEDGGYCPDCEKGSHVYDMGRAALVYDEYMSKSIYAFKYNGKKEFARFYARVMDERLGPVIKSWNPDAVIPVPIHKSKLKKRGYNQAALIAKELAKRLGMRLRTDIVSRCSATRVQKELNAAARHNNLKKAFKVTGNVVQLDSVLIVDDIYTTGATVDALAACLKGAGVRKVYFAALSIGRGN